MTAGLPPYREHAFIDDHPSLQLPPPHSTLTNPNHLPFRVPPTCYDRLEGWGRKKCQILYARWTWADLVFALAALGSPGDCHEGAAFTRLSMREASERQWEANENPDRDWGEGGWNGSQY